jgi:integrase
MTTTRITGVPLTGNVLQVAWQRARTVVGRPDLRLLDLRHTGLTMAAATGATTVELMHRAGHSSPRCAISSRRRIAIASSLTHSE